MRPPLEGWLSWERLLIGLGRRLYLEADPDPDSGPVFAAAVGFKTALCETLADRDLRELTLAVVLTPAGVGGV